MALVVKNLPANAGDVGEAHSIPGAGMATLSSVLAWRTPWTEEPEATVHRVINSWTHLK